jgi:hypothetical protein
MKRIILIGLCILSLFVGYTLFTTYAYGDRISELKSFSNRYVNGTDLTSSVWKDSSENGNELFTLYENNGDYFIVWSNKSIWDFGRYRIQGGSIPQLFPNKLGISEFQKFDSSGMVYILFGNFKQSEIILNIAKSNESSTLKEYEIYGDHTFVFYTNKSDCNIIPVDLY